MSEVMDKNMFFPQNPARIQGLIVLYAAAGGQGGWALQSVPDTMPDFDVNLLQ